MTMSAGLMEWIEARGLDPEVLDRLGFDGTRRDGGDVLVIPFIRDGRIVRRKYRPLEPGEGQPRYTQDKGGVRCLWNEDCLRDESLLTQPLIITEGEMDAAAAIQCGFRRTVSVPDGAPPPGRSEDRQAPEESQKYAWFPEAEPLLTRERVPEVIIASDGDPNGVQLLHDLSRLLGRFRCKYLAYPKAPPGADLPAGRTRLKDLNEVLQFYGQKGVVETINRATFVKITGVAKMSELTPRPAQRIYDIGFDVYGSHFRLRLGDFSVVTGVPSSGKTTFVQDMVCRVVERYGVKVAWGSFEQDPQSDHKRNFRRWFNRAKVFNQTIEQKEAADIWIDRYHLFIVPDDEEDSTLEWLLEKMEVAVLRHGVEIIVLDPWNELDHLRERHETTTEYVGRAIKMLKKFAGRLGVHVMVVAHPTKIQRSKDGSYPEVNLYDISDSAHWYNKADLGVIVHRENKDDTKVRTAKSRFHDIIGTPGAVMMQFNAEEGRFVETERLL